MLDCACTSHTERSAMTRGTRTRLTILLTAALVPLAGCSGGDASDAPNTGPATQSPAPPLHVEATLHIPAAGTVVTTHDRLWVISGGKTVVTQIDPDTNSITKQVKVPHPVAYGTVEHGSLWLVSYGDNALIEARRGLGQGPENSRKLTPLAAEGSRGCRRYRPRACGSSTTATPVLRIDEESGKLTQTTNMPGDAAAGPFLVRSGAVGGDDCPGHLSPGRHRNRSDRRPAHPRPHRPVRVGSPSSAATSGPRASCLATSPASTAPADSIPPPAR